MALNTPEIIEGIGSIQYFFEDLGLKVNVERMSDEGKAELWVFSANGKGDYKLLHTASTNLMSTSTMNSLSKRLREHSAKIDWTDILTFITAKTMEIVRKGEPGVVLKPVSADLVRPTYHIEPLIMKGVPSVIFGDKGVNKTTIALTALGLLSCGCDYSTSGMIASESISVGILDWEGTEELTNYTLSRLIEAGSIPYCEIPYLRCKQALVDDVERIAKFLQEHSIKVALIDSLGQAAGSDKYDSAGKGAALKFFEVLRQLNLTSLIIAQNAKGEEGKKTIYGSTYYTYYSRNIFELRRAKDTTREDDMHIALIHQEGNYSKKYKPIGYHLTYTDTSILIEPEEVSLSQLKDRIEDTEVILEYLRLENRLCSVAEIAEALGKTENQTRVTLSLLKKRGKLVNPERGQWGLAHQET